MTELLCGQYMGLGDKEVKAPTCI